MLAVMEVAQTNKRYTIVFKVGSNYISSRQDTVKDNTSTLFTSNGRAALVVESIRPT